MSNSECRTLNTGRKPTRAFYPFCTCSKHKLKTNSPLRLTLSVSKGRYVILLILHFFPQISRSLLLLLGYYCLYPHVVLKERFFGAAEWSSFLLCISISFYWPAFCWYIENGSWSCWISCFFCVCVIKNIPAMWICSIRAASRYVFKSRCL